MARVVRAQVQFKMQSRASLPKRVSSFLKRLLRR